MKPAKMHISTADFTVVEFIFQNSDSFSQTTMVRVAHRMFLEIGFPVFSGD